MGLNLQTNRSLSEFSTFGIGGPIRYFLEIHSIEEAEAAFHWARVNCIPIMILGKGSNCLFSDSSFDGLALLNKIDFCEIEGCEIYVGSGYSFSLLGVKTARRGLSGLEFASGIPATVGGAIFMNAGANNQEVSEALESVTYLFESGEKKEFKKPDISFSYRTSSFQTMKGCILSARFLLQQNQLARSRQLQIIDYRMKTQPIKDKSAGCVFRNPSKEVSAGALIDRCGLKGLKIGDAEISPMHANYIVNRGGAKATDVLDLIQFVREKVFEQTGIFLETEIKVLP